MRENIGLFHGKRKDNGKWVCGDLVHSWENMNAKPDIQIHNNMGYFDVIPETVGEYTGLTDKNGKKVFEGDILHVSSELKAIVTWFAEESRYLLEFYVDGNKYESGLYEMTVKGYEVIGNIHDDRELLKGEIK